MIAGENNAVVAAEGEEEKGNADAGSEAVNFR